jgi:hypothetical protein
MKKERPALLVRVLMELANGKVDERWISDKRSFVSGLCEGKRITVNPMVDVVDTLLHEALHRMQPEWSESYVRNRTTWLMRRCSDEQIQALYESYQKIKKPRKPKRDDG